MSSKSIITVQRLSKHYDNHKILENVDIDIFESDFTVIMGPSGAGKSTLLQNISTMDKPTNGKVLFNHQDLTQFTDKKLSQFRKKEIGFIFQSFNLIDHLSVLENVCLPGFLLHSKSKQQVVKRARQLLTNLGLSGQIDQAITHLSGGQKQRVAIARSLINQPKLLFADEPTGALDSTAGTEVLDSLTLNNQNGQTIVMVTHDLKAALRADRILFIKDGKIFGDRKFSPYDVDQIETRRTEITSWLEEMGW
ncbi:ABC transporter ATP-binding protein [Leuconostoc mesenteroides]|uniref:ABC transporter ATP-binding protein n=1 Tax=Leuconostoc mesenteroides TaxID=1245 RepID=UPI0009041E09|nr:ABC transporter ATP-binding protein [Leuconostoc mesenteroides]APE76682.1 ABC transporter ATP-binding protein [Leuconostoc mesenteroides subsp. jonggajibkimchii]